MSPPRASDGEGVGDRRRPPLGEVRPERADERFAQDEPRDASGDGDRRRSRQHGVVAPTSAGTSGRLSNRIYATRDRAWIDAIGQRRSHALAIDESPTAERTMRQVAALGGPGRALCRQTPLELGLWPGPKPPATRAWPQMCSSSHGEGAIRCCWAGLSRLAARPGDRRGPSSRRRCRVGRRGWCARDRTLDASPAWSRLRNARSSDLAAGRLPS